MQHDQGICSSQTPDLHCQPAAVLMQRQASSTRLPCFLTLLLHSGCIHLCIGSFVLHADGALQTVESYSNQKSNSQPTFWRRRDAQCKRPVTVHLKMSSVPQTSVLSVPLCIRCIQPRLQQQGKTSSAGASGWLSSHCGPRRT